MSWRNCSTKMKFRSSRARSLICSTPPKARSAVFRASFTGISELARVKLARHSDWRQTDRYTDPKSLPLFAEMEKLGLSLPSSLASPNFGKTGQNSSKVVQSDFTSENPKVLPLRGETLVLGKAVPSWESSEMVPEGGLEPLRQVLEQPVGVRIARVQIPYLPLWLPRMLTRSVLSWPQLSELGQS